MASPWRERCRRMCEGKIQHPTEVEAGIHAERLWQQEGEFATVYECGCCGYWHVGGSGLANGRRHEVKAPQWSSA